MELPQFQLLDFGIFDSRIKFPNVDVTSKRPVEFYEIEVMIGDFGGCSYIEGLAYPHESIDVICTKPGQERYSALPFKCYYLHLTANNASAVKMLNSLPDAFQIGDISEYRSIFNRMMRTVFPNQDTQVLHLSSCLNEILALALRDSNISALQSGVIGNKQALLASERYLHTHYQHPVSLNDLAEVANISPIYFHKLFAAYFHKTPNQYLLDLRIEQAKRMLLEEDFSLTDIALSCGFTSQSYFCNRFKNFTGVTPLQYRKKELSKVSI